jgi:hypothetical protein
MCRLGRHLCVQRTMQTDPAAQILTQLRNALLSLHKALLDSERAIYERDVARIHSPGEFLGLLMDDPWFAYLRELSRFVVEIDEKLDAKEDPATIADANRFIVQARALITPAENGRGFEKRYFEAMQRDPNVVLAHAATARLIAGLRPA